MIIPCMKRIDWVVSGLAFLQMELTRTQFDTLTLVATALILGSKFKLVEISRMWLNEKVVSTLSWFFTDAKISIERLQNSYAKTLFSTYNLDQGFFLIDDTMEHHSVLCQFIHGVSILYDHVFKTNLKAKCIVALYYTDGLLIKFPVAFRLYYKETERQKWYEIENEKCVHQKKYELGLEMLKWAMNKGFPRFTVLADSWFGIEPFVRGLKKLNLSFILELKSSYMIKSNYTTPKYTKTGKLAKKQFEYLKPEDFFKKIKNYNQCGLEKDIETGKKAKILYHCKISTVILKAFPGKYRLLQSYDPAKKTTKYFFTNQLTWDSVRILKNYSFRWVIEEFFKNAKQLINMEGVTIRSKQGVTLALCLVFWIDFLHNNKNYNCCIVEKTLKEPLTIPSITREAQLKNAYLFIDKIKNDEGFVKKWIEIEEKATFRNRKKTKELVDFGEVNQTLMDEAA